MSTAAAVVVEFDELTRQNVVAESLFSAFNGVYMALAILAAPVVAVAGVGAGPLELTVLVAAFPVGVFFGPLWAGFGRRVGMKQLVLWMAVWANLPLFFLISVTESWPFTLLVSASQVLNSGMRMGQSSLYHELYPRAVRGRVLGILTFWTFVTMVPAILVTGWLLDKSREFYQVLYPLAGLCGLIGCVFYRQLQLPGEREREAAVLPPAPGFAGEGSKGTLTPGPSPAEPGEGRKTTPTAGGADAIPSAVAREEESPPDAPPAGGLARVAHILANDRAFLLFQAAFFCSGSAFFISTHVVLILVQETFRFSAFWLALWMSVVPQLLLAVSAPLWGPVLDRVGIVRCRLLLSMVMTVYLTCYFLGIVCSLRWLVYAGSILLGVTNGGGQLTWSLASSHFAPRAEDVPHYNGIHFVLNGVRGLVMPWVGSVLWVFLGPGAVLAATLVSLGSVPIILRSLREPPGGARSSPPEDPRS
jgi:MFS family permease